MVVFVKILSTVQHLGKIVNIRLDYGAAQQNVFTDYI